MAPPNSHPKLFLLIPVYNEAGNIVRLLDCLEVFAQDLSNRYGVEVVLIDDGSRDDTEQLARQHVSKYPRHLLSHAQNQGPGRAFGTGFEAIASMASDDDLVVTLEGDNTSRLELVKQMLHRLEEGFDVILASPYLYGGAIVHTSVFRIFLSSMANLFVKELLGIHGIFTVSSFYRMYRVPMLRKLQAAYGPSIIERAGFECMTEMLMKMIYLEARISEIARVLDTKLRVGRSHMKIRKTILGYYALWRLQDKWRRMADLLLHPVRDGAETAPLGIHPVSRA
jgi:dolichol-phosphate mannosyltransferase